jgi:hypothetical protein
MGGGEKRKRYTFTVTQTSFLQVEFGNIYLNTKDFRVCHGDTLKEMSAG